jgi:thymidylate synthase (FAD)
MQVQLKSITPNAELNIVEIARVSSTRTDKSEAPEKLIDYLIKNKHWSPFEHAMMTVEIVTSKAIGIQLLRHRSFTFQEFSQRYAKVENLEPIELRMQADKNRQSSTEVFNPEIEVRVGIATPEDLYMKGPAEEVISWYQDLGKQLYNSLLAANVAKECARMVLPMNTQTTIYMSGTVRSWIHFIQMRVDPHAQLEAQLIGLEVRRIFKEQMPNLALALGY